MMQNSTLRAAIICVEGPSAVGKTTLANALATRASAVVISELSAGEAPPIPESAAWFVERHAMQWQHAINATAAAPLVVLDGDPFKGLWYNWIFADAGWPGAEVVAPLYRTRIAEGTLAFPDLYVVLEATHAQLRARRGGDPTRMRRNFETHLRLVAPQRQYFAALETIAPGRVVFLDTSERERLPHEVLAAVSRRPRATVDSDRLLDEMIIWVRAHSPGENG
jgi:thymidylate kinase